MRGVMRSAARLTYARAQRAFDGQPDAEMNATVRKTLADLWAAYKTLTIAREKRSPLDLDLPERRIVLGADGKVASIAYRERLESMKLIEECMVLANVAAAEALEEKRTPLIYRIHDTPSKEKLFAFSDFLRTLNINFAKGQVVQPGTFNRILAGAKGTPHEAVMNDVVLRSQAQAIYDAANIGHFGLNLAKYAHFTSPIRRYADLIVHRALIRGLKLGGGGGLTDREIKQSAADRRSDFPHRTQGHGGGTRFHRPLCRRLYAGASRRHLRSAHHRRDQVRPVRAAERLRRGRLVAGARSLGLEYFRHDERRQAMIGERTGTSYGLGDTITVKLVEAAPVTGGLRFELADAAGAPARTNRPGKARPEAPKASASNRKSDNFQPLGGIRLTGRGRCGMTRPLTAYFSGVPPWPNRPPPRFASTAKAIAAFSMSPGRTPAP